MTQFTRHHSHHCHLRHFRPVPRVPPVDHPLSCNYTPSMNIRPCTSICWPYIHMKATGKHGGIYKMWIPVSFQYQAGSPVIQLMQNPPVPPLSVLPHPWPYSGAGIVGFMASQINIHNCRYRQLWINVNLACHTAWPQGFVSVCRLVVGSPCIPGSRYLHIEEVDQTQWTPFWRARGWNADHSRLCRESLMQL